MTWDCTRGCGAGGSKTYPTAEAAARYAHALSDEGRESLGRRAPLIGLLPLRLWRMAKDRRRP
ncbi:hypothetical protein GCM10023159_13090 [Brevibacterium yomogidense]